MRLIKYLRIETKHILLIVLTALFLTGCQGLIPSTDRTSGDLTQNSAYYLQQAEYSTGETRVDWQLLAARALLAEGSTQPALSLLMNQLPPMLTPAQDQERTLLRAEVAAKQQDNKGMLQWLNNINVNKLSDTQKVRYLRVETQVYQGRDPLTQLRAYINLEPLVSAEERPTVINNTWSLVSQLTPQVQHSLVIYANEETLRGWLELLQVYQNNKADTTMLASAVHDWQTRYPRHPAAQTLPGPLTRALTYQQGASPHVALLLPLTGPASKFGAPIEEGFTAAKNQSSAGSQVQVRVYDTGSKSIADLVTQAEQEGASMIVGPLLKNEVEELAGLKTSLSVLALNQPERMNYRANMCYFSLSPEDEAADAARHIYGQGKKAPLIFVPRGNFGERVARAFGEQWQQFDANPARVQYFGSLNDLKETVARGGGISLAGQPINPYNTAGSTSRQVDAIYIVATQPELALIKPMLDISRVTKTATLYASSRSNQAGTGPDFRFEMSGIQFSEIPLLLGLSPDVARASQQKYSGDYNLYRLFGMGADAWELATYFAEIRQLPDYQIRGTTGILKADDNCVIHRQLPWIQYQQGQLVPVR